MNINKLKRELNKMKKDIEKEYIIFYNDGSNEVTTKKKLIESSNIYHDNYMWIDDRFTSACKKFSGKNEFDNLVMNLQVGIIYDKNDVNEDNTIKKGAKPLNGKIHFKTKNIDSYKDSVKTNNESFAYDYYDSREDFINYDYLLFRSKITGVNVNGPSSFKELKDKINNNEKFDINLSLNFKKNKTLSLKK